MEWVCVKASSHDPFLRIRFLLVRKIGSCEQIENDLMTTGFVSLKTRIEIEHALFRPELFLKDKRRRQTLHDIPVIALAPNPGGNS